MGRILFPVSLVVDLLLIFLSLSELMGCCDFLGRFDSCGFLFICFVACEMGMSSGYFCV